MPPAQPPPPPHNGPMTGRPLGPGGHPDPKFATIEHNRFGISALPMGPGKASFCQTKACQAALYSLEVGQAAQADP